MKRCPYCDKEYSDRAQALECARSHAPEDVMTISFLKEDYQRLVMAIMFNNPKLITERLYRKLTRYYKK